MTVAVAVAVFSFFLDSVKPVSEMETMIAMAVAGGASLLTWYYAYVVLVLAGLLFVATEVWAPWVF